MNAAHGPASASSRSGASRLARTQRPSPATSARVLPRFALIPHVLSSRRQSLRTRNIACAFSSDSFAHVTAVERLQEQELEILLPLPLDVEGLADDPSTHNPLKRMEQLGTGWFGVIMEYEGVIVESSWEEHQASWVQVAIEFGYPKPLGHVFRRIRGCRDELVASRVFNWTKNPTTLRTLVERKVEIFDSLVAGSTGRQPAAVLEIVPFLQMLKKSGIPVALVTPLPERKVKDALKRHGLTEGFDVVVTAEDSGAPEVEYYYMCAASQLQRPPMRCIVIGDSNTSVEAAHELGMKSLVPTGHKPVYDFTGADMVVRNLGQLAFLNLKQLFAQETLVRPRHLDYEEYSSSPEAFSDGLSDEED